MKKEDLAKLALTGLTSGILVSNIAEGIQLDHNGNATLAKGCGAKGCSSLAAGCGGKSGCSSIADKCGSKCNHVAQGCNAQGNRGEVAENEPKKTLTAPPETKAKSDKYNPNNQNSTYHLLTDDEITLELNGDMLKIYEQMTPETKALTRLVASAACNGTNECKGLNACKTDTNDCAGKGSCKGLGKCSFSDKNLAVRVVAEKMKEKRANLTK